jgi:hypothetical protein
VRAPPIAARLRLSSMPGAALSLQHPPSFVSAACLVRLFHSNTLPRSSLLLHPLSPRNSQGLFTALVHHARDIFASSSELIASPSELFASPWGPVWVWVLTEAEVEATGTEGAAAAGTEGAAAAAVMAEDSEEATGTEGAVEATAAAGSREATVGMRAEALTTRQQTQQSC